MVDEVEADVTKARSHPLVAGVAAKRRAEMVKLAGEFGFSPVARARIHAHPPRPRGKLSEFLKPDDDGAA
jgi:phage terminase small subunit